MNRSLSRIVQFTVHSSHHSALHSIRISLIRTELGSRLFSVSLHHQKRVVRWSNHPLTLVLERGEPCWVKSPLFSKKYCKGVSCTGRNSPAGCLAILQVPLWRSDADKMTRAQFFEVNKVPLPVRGAWSCIGWGGCLFGGGPGPAGSGTCWRTRRTSSPLPQVSTK